jgi:hypothetical protein
MDALIEIARMTFLDCGCDQDAPAAALLSGEVCRAARSARFDCLQRTYQTQGDHHTLAGIPALHY